MSDGVPAALRRVYRDLKDIGARFALVGGMAVSARGHPRFTRDVDFAIAVDSDKDAEAIVRELRMRGYQISTILEQITFKRMATARLVVETSENEALVGVDLLFASCGIEPQIVAAADPLTVEDVTLPVAARAHLIAMKLLSESDKRLQDRQDLIELLALAEPAEIDVCREAIRLIKERGYGRDVDLAARLDEMLAIAKRDDPTA